jgi:hypothetical protein
MPLVILSETRAQGKVASSGRLGQPRIATLMRQYALIGLVLLLPGCSGAYNFFMDTHTHVWNPNQPIADSENIRRVRGLAPQLPPVTPEPGNVWPGPVPPEPTLSDLEKDTTPLGGKVSPDTTSPQTPAAPDHRQPRPTLGGVSTLPPSLPPGTGPAGGAGRNGAIVVPNGNGTSTIITPDGSITTVPTPK